MKAIKILAVVALLVVLLAGGVFAYLFFNLNYLVKEAVETYGPEITKTQVALRSVDIKPFDGKGELSGFVISNPSGFDGPHLLKADKITLQIDPLSVTKDVIVIKEMTIDGVNVSAVQKGLTTNLQEMLKNFKQEPSAGTEATSTESKDVRLIVEKLNFVNNSISLSTESYGDYVVDLPKIQQSGLGSKSNGLTPQELGVAIITPFIERAKDSAEDKLKAILKEKVTDKAKAKVDAKLDEKKEEAKEKLKEKFGEDAEKKLKDLKGLFGK